MHEDFDDEDDNEDDDYNYDHPSLSPYQWYYKFDVGPNTPISNWLNDIVDQWISPDSFKGLPIDWKFFSIPGFPSKKFPVNSWHPDAGKNNSFQYLGANYDGCQIWKKKYFVSNPLNNEYVKHLNANAVHFLRQPDYYKGLFDIMN